MPAAESIIVRFVRDDQSIISKHHLIFIAQTHPTYNPASHR